MRSPGAQGQGLAEPAVVEAIEVNDTACHCYKGVEFRGAGLGVALDIKELKNVARNSVRRWGGSVAVLWAAVIMRTALRQLLVAAVAACAVGCACIAGTGFGSPVSTAAQATAAQATNWP